MPPWNADWLALPTTAALIALVLWFACRRRYVFLITITNGAIQVRHGKVAGPFLEQLRSLCQATCIPKA